MDLQYAKEVGDRPSYLQPLADFAESRATQLNEEYESLEQDLFSYYTLQAYGPGDPNAPRWRDEDFSVKLKHIFARRPEFVDRIASFPLRIVADMEHRVLLTPSLVARRVDKQETPLALLARVCGWTVI
jgi:hypothetical protein